MNFSGIRVNRNFPPALKIPLVHVQLVRPGLFIQRVPRFASGPGVTVPRKARSVIVIEITSPPAEDVNYL